MSERLLHNHRNSGALLRRIHVIAAVLTWIAAIAALSMTSAIAVQRSAPPGRLRGIVVDATTRLPVNNIRVSISSLEGKIAGSTRTEQGTFAFQPGNRNPFTIRVESAGYLPAAYGQMWPLAPAQAIAVPPGGSRTLLVRMWPAATITGQVQTADGHPVESAIVALSRERNGSAMTDLAPLLSRTNKMGDFGFESLPPGHYQLAVRSTPVSQVCRMAAPALATSQDCAYFANEQERAPTERERLVAVRNAIFDRSDAVSLVLLAGRTEQVSLRFRWSPSVRLAGRILGQPEHIGRAHVTIMRQSPGPGASSQTVYSNSNGSFSFSRVAPGSYSVRAVQRYTRSAESSSNSIAEGEIEVAVDVNDIDNLELPMQSPSRISGTLEFQGYTKPPQGLSMTLVPIDTSEGPLTAPVGMDGSFDFGAVSAARYRITPPAAPGWALQEVTASHQLSPSLILEAKCCAMYQLSLTLTDRLSALRGRITNYSEATGGSGVMVFIFPADGEDADRRGSPAELHQFRTVVPSTNGEFVVGDLLPYEYNVIAVHDGVFNFEWTEDETLTALQRSSQRVIVRRAVATSVDLQAVRIVQ